MFRFNSVDRRIWF